MRKFLLLGLVLSYAGYAQQATTSSIPTTSTVSSISAAAWEPTTLNFSCGIVMNLKTGAVTLPKNMPLDQASMEFWGAVSQMFAKNHSDSKWTLLETLNEAKRENAALTAFMSGTQSEDFLVKEGKMLDTYIQQTRGTIK